MEAGGVYGNRPGRGEREALFPEGEEPSHLPLQERKVES